MAPYLRLLAAQVAIGAAAIFARFALTGTGPLGASALRLAIAAVPLVIVSLITDQRRSLGRRAEIALAVAGLLLGLHFATWLASLEYTSVAVSTLLVCTSPLWTGLHEWLVLKRQPARRFGIALILAAAGLALVVSRRDLPAPIEGHTLLGAVLALAGGLAIAAYFLVVQAVRAESEGVAPSTRRIVVRTYAWAALALGIAAAFARQGPPPLTATTAWFGIFAMAFVSQMIGHTALNAALRDFPSSTVAMSTLLEPVVAALLAVWIFHESASPLTALGGVLILAAIGLASVAPTESNATAKDDATAGGDTTARGDTLSP